MAGCVLRVSSLTDNVEALLDVSRLKACAIFRKGEPRIAGSSVTNCVSGFNVVVSNADGAAMDKQVRDAVRFLKRHKERLQRLKRHKEFGGMSLDFGLWMPGEDVICRSYTCPATLIELAGKLKIEIEISLYSTDNDAAG